MVYSVSELREILNNGENSAVEFKTADVRKESIAREMVAFSNTLGGTILVGVNDDGAITGEKLKVGVSYAINPILVKFMENLRYIDHLGRGLPMVYREAIKNNQKVEFKEVGDEFWVILGRE